MSIKNFMDDDFYEDEEVKKLSKTILPDPTLLDYYNRLSKREIFWNTLVDEEIVEYSHQVIRWNQEDKKNNIPIENRIPIRVFINTDGGCLNSIMNFINVIQLSKTPVWTIGMGKTYSAGSLLLMSGHKRLIFAETNCLVHNGYTGAFGDTGKVMDNLEFTQKLEERVKKYILKNTKITEKLYDKNYRRDWWMTSDDIIQYGIADKIIEDIDEII